MNNGASATSPHNSFQTHFLDIHEVLPEDEEEEGVIKMEDNKVTRSKKGLQKPIKLRELKRPQRSFNRQVSLETGFSVLGVESKAKDEKKVLRRSGRSFGGFDSANRVGAEARKGDFNIFRTNVPVGRYFDALRGPELDQVKDSEDILLPKDEIWPFLLRFPINCFGICLGLSSQAVLWRALSTSPATKFLHVTPFINLSLWLLALATLISVSITYLLKCIHYFEAVKREYFHPVRVNFFFAPWVVCMFLAIGLPPMLEPAKLHPAIWCAFMGPYFFLELKIYGQWLSGGKRRLCKVANPSSHLSVVGNFVGAILASKVGWIEAAKFLWSIGFAHYIVVFVTLYQRLPTSEALPKELHPVYSMFIAAPSAASIAWGSIYSEFDGCSRTCFFIALFLYISLVVRINFFTGFRFSVAWWSYTFPMTTASVATIKYAEQTLFPNDLAIAITKKRLVQEKKPFKKAYDIKRWTKQALTKNNSGDKEFNMERI
ncbi:hypothetical protein Gotri_013250, partial [Gossypium trilobum]|nr:hypothetical protein [Gossypium trilobum]